jgi:endonuclease III-like uncharacterized protein
LKIDKDKKHILHKLVVHYSAQNWWEAENRIKELVHMGRHMERAAVLSMRVGLQNKKSA